MYERAEDLLRLGFLLQGSRGGVSLDEIRREFGVSRRTAERMRDAALRLFPQMEEAPATGEPVKRWRLPGGTLTGLVSLEPRELEELSLTADRLRREGLVDRASALDGLRAKLSALLVPAARARVETDLEALLEAEGHAMRAGPRPQIRDGLLQALRAAMVGCRVLRLRYRRRGDGRTTSAEVEPHGVLFGQRHYLVAYGAGGGGPPKLYALGNILDAAPTGQGFARRGGFDLRAYAGRSFGVFQEPLADVVWRFPPALAADAMEHHFHPTERKERLPDGRLELRFTAGGLQEMAWELFTWGPGVEVVAPDALRERYAALLREALAPHSPDRGAHHGARAARPAHPGRA